MSQPYRATDLSSSNLAAHPSFSQSSIPPFSSAPKPVLNQKLIPRDFLGTRSKLVRNIVSHPENGVSNTLFSSDPFKNSRTPQTEQTRSIGIYLRDEVIVPSWNSTLSSETHGKNDPSSRVLRTRSSESTALLPPVTTTRSASSGHLTPLDSDQLSRPTMPRTSSIDSAISNVSTTSLNRTAGDVREPSPNSVRNLIATAGGAENLVIHLLKEKNSIASQNAQLWKLLEKQRSLILGLNKDLERLTRERDRYKKRVKELEIHTISEDGDFRPKTSPSPKKGSITMGSAIVLDHKTQLPNVTRQGDDMKISLTSSPRKNEGVAQTREPLGDQDKENMPEVHAPKPILPELHVQPGTPNGSLPKPNHEISNAAPSASNAVEASLSGEKPSKSLPSNRKAPPKPLNLAQGKGDSPIQNQFSAKSDLDEDQERGRRRTRAEDDREREMSAIKADAEARSRSKKNKAPQLITNLNEENQASFLTQVPAPLPTPGLPLSPRPQHAPTFFAPTAHLVAASVQQPASLGERLLAAPLKSPGLPLSPRPVTRNEHPALGISLPLSPRANMGAFPLSPRAPKHALPLPTNLAAPTDAAALHNTQSKTHQASPQTPAPDHVDRLQVHQPVGSEPPPVYRGLAVSAYPNLLLPPNALPSIQVKVHSSRLRASRYTALGIKTQEETTVFSLSIISRSSNSELWRTEKVPAALPQLEQQLRTRYADLPKMPDRKLFTGHSPTLLDERRMAIDNYFDELLDIHVDEQAAVTICRFLSTDVIDPEQQNRSASSPSSDMGVPTISPGRPATKTGYLTKKGKNFGGWKSRFFILDGTDFRYYESAGGPHLGTIRLQNALIGKQKENDYGDDGEGQYRHAFLIQEPKRKESGNYVRHVLCAESDLERDDWVRTLMYWVEAGTTSRSDSRNGSATSTNQDLNDIDSRYQGSKAGPSSKDTVQQTRDTHINTPTPTSGSSIDSSILDHVGPMKPTNISGPLHGGVITDNSTWGYKPATGIVPKEPKDKTHKMSNIFGFKKPDAPPPQEQKPPKPRILRHNGYVRPVFGMPLTEAIEYCAPFNVEVDLPAVVYRSIEYLRYRNAANEEGLFRLSGSNVVVRNLKERFNTEGDIDLTQEEEYHDVHAVASLFKTYLRELPSTLLTRDLHLEFIKVLELESNSDKVSAYNALVHMLPPANFSLLKEMSKYLLEVTRSADKNKMSVRNIGIVFSPTLNIPTPVFTLFLTEYEDIFETESRQRSDIRTTEIKAPITLTPDDIRSPRHQMFSDLPTPAYHQTTFHGSTSLSPPRGTMTGTGELGFMPINPTYESGSYGSMPRTTPQQPASTLTQIPESGGFSSLNGLLAPTNTTTDRARKRQSTGLYSV